MRFVVLPCLAESRLSFLPPGPPGRLMAAALAAAFFLNGCATAPSARSERASVPPSLASSSTAGGHAASGGGSSSAPGFEQVVKGAKRYDGMLPIWHRQEKAWIELSPEDFGKPFFLSPKLSTGIGEAGVFGGLMQSRWAQVGRPQWVEFRKVNQQVQLLAINATFTAQSGTPQARAVASAFSPSLLASVPLASAPQGGSGKVLIEANALLMTDMLGMAQHLQRSYRQSYAMDNRHSALLKAEPHEQGLVFEMSQHFATPGISGGSSVPLSVPDPRSLFVTVRYTLTALPEEPMATRPADARVGYFATTIADFTNDLARTPRLRHINRWRLEKKQPDAPLSEPVRPIVYRLDESIPEAYREAIRDGVLVWNKAFEKIGFKGAVQVRMPAADGEPEGWEPAQATIRWMTNSQPSFGALGPTHVDPRTGEILDADIAIESLSSRSMRTARSQFLSIAPSISPKPVSGRAASASGSPGPEDSARSDGGDAGHTHADGTCEYGLNAAEQLGMAMDVLEARGLLDPDGPEVQAFVLAYLKDTTMHEVGHTLGLRHNFRASRWRTDAELSDAALGREAGNSASVMDYAPINLPLPGHPAGASFQTTLGPYDYWAIEYGYAPLPQDKARAEAMLRDIARRSEAPQWADALAYGSDEDYAQGLDPQALTFDLGRNPVAYARTRLAIVRDLFERQATRRLKAEDDPSLLRRSVGYGLREMARTGQILIRQIGGIVTRRDGPDSTRSLLEPLPAAQQRAALQMLAQDFLSPDAVRLSPALQRRLVPDYLDRQPNDDASYSASSTDFSLAEQQLALQRGVLSGLMSETLAERLLDNIDKTRDTERRPLTPQELHRALRQAIWSGKPHPRTQDSAARNLQREHVRRLAEAVARNDSDRADVRALLRGEATQLLGQLRAQKPGADTLEAAHRRDCIDTLASALSPSVVRMAAP